MFVRRYGQSGPQVLVLHGGPAAYGDAAQLAEGMSPSFRAIEPWQRRSGGEPLSVACHVADTHKLVVEIDSDTPLAIVGHSWGAMLALCYAAEYPEHVGRIVLVGCGTFDQASRERRREILEERMNEDLRTELHRNESDTVDPVERFIRKFKLTRHLSDFDLIESYADGEEWEPFDLQAHSETWGDMMRLEKENNYPQAFAVIRSPVLLVQGDYDPHPGQMIRDNLIRFIAHMEYRELECCGHYPWKEKAAREEFFSVISAWLG
ncbi:MAG: alpha/beta fold hydrolase [Woeseiaceae bacterium]